MKVKANLRKLAVVCFTILALGVPGISNSGTGFSRIFIFGDSLSDAGNIWAVNGNVVSTAPYLPIPSAPYASDDGFMFSNGKTWAQVFTKKMGHEDSGKAALLAPPGTNGNYAFGGARARLITDVPRAPTASEQVDMFLGFYGPDNVDSNALYVVQFGGNDLRDALVAAGMASSPAEADMKINEIFVAAIGTTIGNITRLYYNGARSFLVANVGNLGLAPAVKFQGAGPLAEVLSSIYNDGLEFGLTSLEIPLSPNFLPGISIDRLDIFGFTNAVYATPGDFDITERNIPCLNFLAETDLGAICEDPDEHLFWDGIHPTAAIHSELGEMADEQLDDDDN